MLPGPAKGVADLPGRLSRLAELEHAEVRQLPGYRTLDAIENQAIVGRVRVAISVYWTFQETTDRH
jgi:hypothetical protein